MSTHTVSTTFFAVNPKTEEEEPFWIDVEITKDPEVHTLSNGEPGHPGSMNVEILEWGACQDDSQPTWLAKEYLDEVADQILDKFDPTDLYEDEEYDD